MRGHSICSGAHFRRLYNNSVVCGAWFGSELSQANVHLVWKCEVSYSLSDFQPPSTYEVEEKLFISSWCRPKEARLEKGWPF